MILRHISWGATPDTDKRESPLPWQERGLQYTASGYGRRIPTRRMIRINKRRRRIYCCIFSNAGTCYVLQGKDWIVITD